MLCFLFVPAFDYKIYCLMLYHLLKSTLHPKANACSIGTFITFYMQSSLYSKANACNIGTFIRFYNQMRVPKKPKHLPIDSIGHSHNSVSLDQSKNTLLDYATFKELIMPSTDLLS